jgi:propanol-preferring alcohol dehydrogenase
MSEVADPEPSTGEVAIRVEAAGICHSDAHYRSGDPATGTLPITLGHEIAGVVVTTGEGVDAEWIGRRVAVHYVVSDGVCGRCRRFGEQFCENYEMLGMTRDGGYAELIAVPVGNAVPVPADVALEHAAVMMCSSATSLHALRKGRLQQGETVAVFGVGGLGMSAIQLAFALGARRVLAVDIDDTRLEMATRFGALPVPAREDPAGAIRSSGGADVALALVGNSAVFATALASLGTRGRLVAVGIGREPVPVAPYGDLILGEHELIGSNDHTLTEIHDLFAFAEQGRLQLDDVVTGQIPLDAAPVNATLDRLDGFGPGVRTVILPGL